MAGSQHGFREGVYEVSVANKRAAVEGTPDRDSLARSKVPPMEMMLVGPKWRSAQPPLQREACYVENCPRDITVNYRSYKIAVRLKQKRVHVATVNEDGYVENMGRRRMPSKRRSANSHPRHRR